MEDDIPRFEAPVLGERRVVGAKNPKFIHQSRIPDEILNNDFLNSLISVSLPKNYNFEVHKTIWKIKQTGARLVLLQLPEGLIRFGVLLVDIISAYFRENNELVHLIVMGDLTYGACCVDDYLASSMGCDLIVHYAHSCLVPINAMNKSISYLYIFLDIKFDVDHLIDCVIHNFEPSNNVIAIASTIQFVASIHDIARRLRLHGFDVKLPQSRPLSSGEVLGCTAPELDSTIDTILFVCDGRFHLEALMIANPRVTSYRYDPYSRKLTREFYAFGSMIQQRSLAIEKAHSYLTNGGTFGLVLGTLGRQGSWNVYSNIIEKLSAIEGCKTLRLTIPEVTQDILNEVEGVDAWVQVACPRLSIDWGVHFKTPLLNPFELSQVVKFHATGINPLGNDQNSIKYPMDFYAKASCGNHTPNHVCQAQKVCDCHSQPEIP